MKTTSKSNNNMKKEETVNTVNGKSLTVVKEADKKTENAPEPKKVEETTAEKGATKINELLTPTAEQRIRNLENFQILSKRFQALKDKQDELNKFILSSDGTKEKITLQNANGFKFEVSNSQTIENVTDLIQANLTVILTKTEQEILNFTI